MRIRHYLGSAAYKEFYILNVAGKLDKLPQGTTPINEYIARNNSFNNNYNIVNVDMVYSWRFAPGSEINIVWKNAIGVFDREVITDYFKNVNNTLGSPQNNSISFKILYFLDYLQLQKKKL